jgi:hypothetical protein
MSKQLVFVGASIFIAALIATACGALTPAAPETPRVSSTEPAENEAVNTTGASVRDGAKVELLPPSSPPFSTSGWTTDFTRRTIAWEEIISGGPPKDGIPAIDAPTFESVDAAASWLSERDPVILYKEGEDIRAYPLAILMWHEIVNDTVGGRPVAVTFCPLCNASIVFDRTFDGEVLDFGTTGRLRNSDLIMYDRQTETWWQQFTGEGIVGRYAGERLAFLPSQVLSFADFAAEFPNAQALARPAFPRSYGVNPYTRYDSSSQPFLFHGEIDPRLPATERVAGIALLGEVKAYPFTAVAAAGAINDEVGGTPLVILHKPGVASALDASAISEGRDVGSVAVFDRRIDGRTLTFTANGDGLFIDEQTGSTWNILGQAIAGELAGKQLTQQIAFDHFWFAWAAFHPETALYDAP